MKLTHLKTSLPTLNTFTGSILQPASPQERDQLRREAYDKARQSDPIRALYRTQRWKNLRIQLYHERGGICECGCGTRTVLYEREATKLTPVAVFDHDPVDARSDPSRFYDPNNIKLRAKPCHDRRTATEQGFARKY